MHLGKPRKIVADKLGARAAVTLVITCSRLNTIVI
jgi:hypothetical protein